MVQQVGTVLARGLLPVLLLFAARPLLAAPIAIDFTDNAFAGAAGAGSFTTTILGITVRLDALESGATLTRPNSDPDAFRDGIGIDSSYEDDELEAPELLVITLTAPQSLRWLRIHLTDLFYEGSPRYQERGAVWRRWASACGGGRHGSHRRRPAGGWLMIEGPSAPSLCAAFSSCYTCSRTLRHPRPWSSIADNSLTVEACSGRSARLALAVSPPAWSYNSRAVTAPVCREIHSV
jgi:hypothetical protein